MSTETDPCPLCGHARGPGGEAVHYEGCAESRGDYDTEPMSEARVREIVREEMAKAKP